MNSEEKFKELLNQKLGAKEFPFNADNWNKAKDLIDASRVRKKRRAMVLWSLLLLMVVGTGGYLVTGLKHNSPAGTAPLSNKDIHKTADAPVADIKPAGTVDKNNTTSEKQTATATAPATEARVLKTLPTREIQAPAAHEQPAAANTGGPLAEKTPAADKPPVEPLAETNNNPVVKSGNAPSGDKTDVAVTMPATNDTKQETPDTRTTPEPEKQAEPDAEQTLPVIAKKAEEIKNTEAEPVAEIVLPATPAETVTAKTVSMDTLAAVTVNEAVALDKTKAPFIRNVVFAEAGANYLAGWKNGDTRDANGFNPIVGVGYLNFLTQSTALSFGIQYSTVGNLKSYSHTSKVTRMGLGEESAVTVITPVKMHYLAAPLKIHVALNAKSFIGLGYTLAYLLTVDNKVQTYDQFTNYSDQPRTTTKTRGYSEGFSGFNSQLSAFYRRRIANNLYINGELIFGLTDIKDNKFFGSRTYERDLGVKLTLMYHLFKK